MLHGLMTKKHQKIMLNIPMTKKNECRKRKIFKIVKEKHPKQNNENLNLNCEFEK